MKYYVTIKKDELFIDMIHLPNLLLYRKNKTFRINIQSLPFLCKNYQKTFDIQCIEKDMEIFISKC